MELIAGGSSRLAALREFLEELPRSCPHGIFRQGHARASAHKGSFD
jgi:hypothetical protein